MERLTHPRNSGIKTGYWSPNKKDELVERLAAYEDTGLTPEEIKELKENKNPRWIPVEERLPEESLNSVIGWDEYRERCCFVQYYAGSWHLGDESVRIIAWMPLPEASTEPECSTVTRSVFIIWVGMVRVMRDASRPSRWRCSPAF